VAATKTNTPLTELIAAFLSLRSQLIVAAVISETKINVTAKPNLPFKGETATMNNVLMAVNKMPRISAAEFLSFGRQGF
jgi:hypothetical protein